MSPRLGLGRSVEELFGYGIHRDEHRSAIQDGKSGVEGAHLDVFFGFNIMHRYTLQELGHVVMQGLPRGMGGMILRLQETQVCLHAVTCRLRDGTPFLILPSSSKEDDAIFQLFQGLFKGVVVCLRSSLMECRSDLLPGVLDLMGTLSG